MDLSGYDSVKGEVEVLPVVDIRKKWREVAWDMIPAIFCLFPGIGIFPWSWLLYKYCWARPQPQRELGCEKVHLFFVWSSVLLNPLLEMYIIWIQYRAFQLCMLDLRSILRFWELSLLTNAIWMGSSFGWLILSRHRDEIVQSVCAHKKQNKQILMADARAGDLLDKLFRLFPQQFNEKIDKYASSPLCSREGCIPLSTYALALLMIPTLVHSFNQINHVWVNLPHDESTQALLGSFSVPRFLVFWTYSSFVSLAIVSWMSFIRSVLITTSVHMRENCRQLLLFTALTRSEEWHSRWSKQNRDALKDIVGGSLDGETTSASCRSLARSFEMSEDEEDGLKTRLRQTIEHDQVAKKHELDLGQENDIKAWWLLRQYIQIDFLDEVVVAECCGVVIMILLFLFFLVAVMEWLQNQYQITCALVLVSWLIVTLVVSMWDLFQACVAINTLWEQDDHTLVDAIVTSAMQGQSELKGLLESLQRKVVLSDARQELFGIRVTQALQNAWALSIGICILSTVWEVAKPLMEKPDLESMENALANWTNASTCSTHRFGH